MQQELRQLAHLADEWVLKDAFAKGYDIHSLTASGMVELMDVPYPLNLGGEYVAFEMIRDKKARPIMVEHGKEILKEALPVDDVIQCFPYEDADHVKAIYERVTALEDDVYLSAIEFFEKVRKDAKIVNFGE